MSLVNRLLLGLFLLAGVVRMALFLLYVVCELPSPLEVYYLEAKMVHLAWRVQHGVRFYPEWRDYPYVANIFGPCYFGLVGWLGRAVDADLRELTLISRVVTVGSSLLTSFGVGLYLGRRYGTGAGWVGAVFSLGCAPMHGFAVMARPDTMADLLGATGFFLAVRPARGWCLTGCLLLILAVLTKQTAGAFLLAAAAASWVEGRRRRAALMLAGCGAALVGVVAVVAAAIEPNFVASLLGASVMPWEIGAWLLVMKDLVRLCPDLILFPLVGLLLWNTGRRRGVELTVLTVVLVLIGTATVAKRGSYLNYFLGLRVVMGLAVGTLWRVVSDPQVRKRPVLALALILGIASLYPGAVRMLSGFVQALELRQLLKTTKGIALMRLHEHLCKAAENPDVHLLTDDGLIDIHQGERTAFGDPWLFRQLVLLGEITPRVMEQRVEQGEYDLILTRHDLFAPSYESYINGLPMPVVVRARRRYQFDRARSSFFFYTRRGTAPSPPNEPGAIP